MRRPLSIVAWLGRLALGALLVGFFVLVATQFTHMVARNVATAAELRTVERDLIVLRAQKIDSPALRPARRDSRNPRSSAPHRTA